jgi:hypothetical protein
MTDGAGGGMSSSSSAIVTVPQYIVEPLDYLLLQVMEASPSQEVVDALGGSVRELRQEMQQLLPLCAHSLALQQQALEVTKQLRHQLDPHQIANGEHWHRLLLYSLMCLVNLCTNANKR